MTLREKVEQAPDRPGVYLYADARGQILYVGKAASLRNRVRSYFQESRTRDPKTDALVAHVRDVEYIVTANELEALILESNLVKKHRPRYNIILRDDKHYPFLKLTTGEDFPRLVVARRVQKDGGAYYGPFYPATAMRETLRLVRQLFPLRTCRIKIDGQLPRPCIQYFIHRCHAPCAGLETREAYRRTVDAVQRFLEGKDEELARELTREMEAAAAATRFEQAAALRDRIQALNTVRERQKIISTEDMEQDIVGVVRQGSEACVQIFFVRKGRLLGRESFFFDRVSGWTDGEILSAFVHQFYARQVMPPPEILLSAELPDAALTAAWLGQSRGGRVELSTPQRGRRRELVAMAEENAALALRTHLLSRGSRGQAVLEGLERALGLPGPPHRIEAFDISTIQGSETVASMVVWQSGDMKKDEYKRYRIRTVTGTDDLASMREVLTRRYARALETAAPLPDLILLDGGRGQLAVGSKVLEDLGLDYLAIAALAKRAEEVYVPDRLAPLLLELGSPALQTLQKIRDEAHRFAITYHKTLRRRRTISSELDRIPGVGPRLRTSLLRSLGSARGVRAASVAELAAVPKITPRLAQRIHDFFRPTPQAGEPGSGSGS
ncbi:MAG: excinuclease ABC subunit C [Candidatus Rokubacteria bacterium GWC2_70_16]|nr:MAG: excinuclease ABC subunit C [Candidatus Rokubacteria bacterium GWC2_70_16]OGL18476.1 MAG: excinuclease ABC subunit C [Candidatus Rokubacteria bacterium RIFCSPLOWO2_12_FULL_71_19]